jgi:hypothetical protein
MFKQQPLPKSRSFFVECSIKNTQQRSRCRCTARRALFVKCHTRQTFAECFSGFAEYFIYSTGKAAIFGSDPDSQTLLNFIYLSLFIHCLDILFVTV